MKCSRYSPSSASITCSSWPVPSVATQKACVSPRVNSAEPWARGRMPTSATIGRTVLVSRPSIRSPVSRMALRTTSASRSWNSDLPFSVSSPSIASASTILLRTASTLPCRRPLSGSRYASIRPLRAISATRVFRLCSSGEGSLSVHGSFAACSASSMIAWITGWKLWWPKVTAPSMTSSVSSRALGFHHQHAVRRAGDHQFELAALRLLGGRVEHVLARPHSPRARRRPGRRTGCPTA